MLSFCFLPLFLTALHWTIQKWWGERAIRAILTQFYAANILIGSLPIAFPQLLIKPPCCGESAKKKSETIFSCSHNQRKEEKTTLPNSPARAGAGSSNASPLITRMARTARILSWKPLQQFALFTSLSGAALAVSNKWPLLQAWAFPCSFCTWIATNVLPN